MVPRDGLPTGEYSELSSEVPVLLALYRDSANRCLLREPILLFRVECAILPWSSPPAKQAADRLSLSYADLRNRGLNDPRDLSTELMSVTRLNRR